MQLVRPDEVHLSGPAGAIAHHPQIVDEGGHRSGEPISDWSTVSYIAHNLQGSAASLGLVALESGAQVLERCAKSEDAQGVADGFDEFPELYEASSRALRQCWQAVSESHVPHVLEASGVNR